MLGLYGTLAVLVLVLAVWYLLRPLTRTEDGAAREEHHQLQLVRDRLAVQLNELDIEERDGNMDAATAREERARMEAELAQVLARIDAAAVQSLKTKAPTTDAGVRRAALVVLAVFVSVVSLGFYWVNATVAPTQLEQVASEPAPQPAFGPEQMVARLEARLQANPQDVAGWLLLGRSYVVLGRTDEAAMAYDHAYPLLPKDYVADSPDAMFFLGFAALDRKEYKRADEFWNKLLTTLPSDSAETQRIKEIMDQARQQARAGKSGKSP